MSHSVTEEKSKTPVAGRVMTAVVATGTLVHSPRHIGRRGGGSHNSMHLPYKEVTFYFRSLGCPLPPKNVVLGQTPLTVATFQNTSSVETMFFDSPRGVRHFTFRPWSTLPYYGNGHAGIDDFWGRYQISLCQCFGTPLAQKKLATRQLKLPIGPY